MFTISIANEAWIISLDFSLEEWKYPKCLSGKNSEIFNKRKC
ncbi:MAG: hypothetical protein JETT_1815 [Candidatus Jettenia ecosi]|uniref:Uncharacterized protein n=1 Tax=Candidatus Jettenia ecosi TaxID=2494326 RepID=A0A533QB51_9BACT|nr:MAG: hypothetical protein JETT_1815 [Candidatus Jettenia ecosi]